MIRAVLVLAVAVAFSRVSATAFMTYLPGEVRVGGEIGRRMEITADKLMHQTDIEKTFVRHFRVRKDKPEVWGGFTGWGMTLDAIVKAAAHGIGGAEMKAFKEKWLAETIATQTTDGSISFFTPGHLGMWDNHEQAYLIQAFCTDYRACGNVAAMEAARRLGDYLIARKSGVNLGLETAFVMLYRETGDVRYLDWVRDAYLIEKDNMAFDMIAVNGVAHVYTWIQRALAQQQYAAATGKALPVLMQSTDELYRRAFGDFLSISGSMSGGSIWGEVWDDTQIGLGKWGETCVSAYLLRCTTERMKASAESRYGDLYERVLYNAFFGAQSADGSKQRYFIPFDEAGEWFDHETYCCPNNLRRMMFELPDAVFFRTSDGFAVNLYAPSTLSTTGLTVRVDTVYPKEGRVLVSVTSDHAGTALLRVPRWTGLGDAGGWRAVGYAAGESKLEIEFPMTVRLVKGRKAKAGRVAVMRGPVVYALDGSRLEKGWMGYIDCLELACDLPLTWTGNGVSATFFEDRGTRPWRTIELLPFASDRRLRTYFPPKGKVVAAVDDELFGGMPHVEEKKGH